MHDPKKPTPGYNDRALAELIPLVYSELHHLAEAYLRSERPNHTLQTTALIHETYLRLREQRQLDLESRHHFFSVAAQTMRRILVDYARQRTTAKRGSGRSTLSLEVLGEISWMDDRELVALDDALQHLARENHQLGRLVELRFFGGFNSQEISELMGVSVPTVTRKWRIAKAWLYRYLRGGDDEV